MLALIGFGVLCVVSVVVSVMFVLLLFASSALGSRFSTGEAVFILVALISLAAWWRFLGSIAPFTLLYVG